jgi:hypothetical protein
LEKSSARCPPQRSNIQPYEAVALFVPITGKTRLTGYSITVNIAFEG